MFSYYDQKSGRVVEVNLKWTHISVSQIIAGRKHCLSLIFFGVRLLIIKITESQGLHVILYRMLTKYYLNI